MNSIFHLVWEYFKLISGFLKKILGLSDDGDVFLVAKLAGESIFSADGVDSVAELWAEPGIHLLELNHVNIQKNVSSITGVRPSKGSVRARKGDV